MKIKKFSQLNSKQRIMLIVSVSFFAFIMVFSIGSYTGFWAIIIDNGGGSPTPPPEPDPFYPPPSQMVPVAPTLQTISSPDTDGSIYLRWNAPTGAIGYKVWMSKDGGTWQAIKSTGAIAIIHSGLTNGVYRFKVNAYNSIGFSPPSIIRSVTVVIPPPVVLPETPILSIIVPNPNIDGKISLSWSSSMRATSYEVFVNGILIDSTTGTTYNDEVTLDGVYSYKIRAKNSGGVSGYSNIESVIVNFPEDEEVGEELVPNSPVMDSLTWTIDLDEMEVQLSWSEVDCDSYNIYKSFDGGDFILIQSDLVSTTYSEIVIEIGLYSYRVTAENDYGESDLSNPTSVMLTEDGFETPVDYTMIYVLLGVLGVLIVMMVLFRKRIKIKR